MYLNAKPRVNPTGQLPLFPLNQTLLQTEIRWNTYTVMTVMYNFTLYSCNRGFELIVLLAASLWCVIVDLTWSMWRRDLSNSSGVQTDPSCQLCAWADRRRGQTKHGEPLLPISSSLLSMQFRWFIKHQKAPSYYCSLKLRIRFRISLEVKLNSGAKFGHFAPQCPLLAELLQPKVEASPARIRVGGGWLIAPQVPGLKEGLLLHAADRTCFQDLSLSEFVPCMGSSEPPSNIQWEFVPCILRLFRLITLILCKQIACSGLLSKSKESTEFPTDRRTDVDIGRKACTLHCLISACSWKMWAWSPNMLCAWLRGLDILVSC